MPTIKTEPHRGWSVALAARLAIGLASMAPKPASAADLGAAPSPPIAAPDDGWQFRFAPVLALMGAVEARHDRWMVFGDANWMRLTAGGAKPNQRTLPSGVGVATSLNADVTSTTFIAEAALGYEVMKWP